MAVYKLDQFFGERPKITSKLLPSGHSQAANTCDLEYSDLRGLRAYNWVANSTKAGVGLQTIFRAKTGDWYTWDDVRHVVDSPLTADIQDRVYWTDSDAQPGWTDSLQDGSGTAMPDAEYTLGVPAPIVAPTIDTLVPSDLDNTTDRLYVFTWVIKWQGVESESAPSPPSEIVTLTPDVDSVTLRFDGVVDAIARPSGNYAPGSAQWFKRIYRSVTGSVGTELYFIDEIAEGTASYVDSKSSLETQELLATEGWEIPPATLEGMVLMPNGILAAFKGNEIWFSVAYQPHAWPVEYSLATDHDIVALGVFGESLVVATKGYPYLVTGVDPASMSMGRLELAQSCVSARSLVDMGEFVVYASPDGLVAIGPGTAQLVTQDVFSREQWQELNPTSMHGYLWEGKYLCSYYVDASNKGTIIFDSKREDIVRAPYYWDTGYSDLTTDTLYLVYEGTKSIFAWVQSGGSRLACDWKSKRIRMDKPSCLAAAQVVGTQTVANPVTFKLYTDYDGFTDPVHTEVVSDNNSFRLPTNYMASEFEVEVLLPISEIAVEQILLASTMRELRNA